MNRISLLKHIFDEALELPDEARQAFVEQRTVDDPALRSEVLAMLHAEQVGSGLNTGDLRQSLIDQVDSMERSRSIGRRIGRYEVIGELGTGGMGRVYKARRFDSGVEQWVALKVVRAELLNPSLTERFSNERQMLVRLNHPGIAHFIDSGSDSDGTAFVAMELVDGEPLLRYAQRNECTLQQRLELFRQLLAAVAHAHRALIIHRDIKPGNVFVRPDGMLKLLDFGIAKAIDVQAAMTQTRDRAFTPLSAAPEQLRGESCDVTTDVYALGLVLYELIAGRAPFDADGLSAGEVERLVLSVPPPPMRARATQPAALGAQDVPVDLENIVAKAVRKEPSLRYASVEQFDADVARFIAHEPVSVSGKGRWYRARKFIERHALASAFASLAVVAVVGALIVALVQAQAIRAERDRANAALTVMTDAFAAADPSGQAGGDVTARQILTSSAQRIATLRESDPASYQRLATALAKVALTLGMSQLAADLLRPITEFEAAGSAEERAEARVLLARALVEQNIVSEAKQLLASLDVERRARLDSRVVEGRIAMRQGDWPTGEQLFAPLANQLTPPEPDWLVAIEQWAGAVSEQKRHEEALAILTAAEAKVAALRGVGHPAAGRLRVARLEALVIAGEHQRAIEIGKPLLSNLRKQFGAKSMLTGNAAGQIGMAYYLAADFAMAAQYFSEATRVYEASFGRLHNKTYRMKFDWASMLTQVPGQERLTEELMAAATQDAVDDVPPHWALVHFFRMELSKVRSGAKTPEALRAALLTIAPAESKTNAQDIDVGNREEVATWTAQLFWDSRCAMRAGASAGTAIDACVAKVVEPDCLPAQELLCDLSGKNGEVPPPAPRVASPST